LWKRALMLDNPEKTARLLAALKAAVPFKVELVPSLVTYLRAQHVAIADQTQHIVSNLSYAGSQRRRRTLAEDPDSTKPELRIPNAAAQTRTVSVARIRLYPRKSCALSKG
jgi:hypothetical protein